MNLQEKRQEFESALVNKAVSDATFRSALIQDPKGTIEENYGLQFGERVRVNVHEESNTDLHLVIPLELQLDGELSDENLETVSGGQYQVVSGGASMLNIPAPSASISVVNSTLTVNPASMGGAAPAGPSIGSSPSTALDLSDPYTLPNTTVNPNATTVQGTLTSVTPKGVGTPYVPPIGSTISNTGISVNRPTSSK